MAEQAVSLAAYARLLRHNRNFRRLWTAQIISELGDWIYAAAVYSNLYELTGSAMALAYAFVTQVLPQSLASPAAGVLNDRLSRRAIMAYSDFGRAVIVGLMVLARTGDMIWLMYVLLGAETLLWALFEPARTAVIPNIMESRDLTVANALSSTTWSFSFTAGFAIGGALTAALGRDTVFLLNAASFIWSGMLILGMRFDEPHLKDRPAFHARELADFSPVIEGARYVARDRKLLATMLVKSGLGPLGSAWVLLPIMGVRVFPLELPGIAPDKAGLLGMSVLMGSRGVGSILGPLIGGPIFGVRDSRQRAGIVCGFLISALGYFALSLTGSLGAAASAMILAHIGSSMVWVFSTTQLQKQTEDRFRGRVFSTEFAGMTIGMAACATLVGFLIDGGFTTHEAARVVAVPMLASGAGWMLALRLWKPDRTAQGLDNKDL